MKYHRNGLGSWTLDRINCISNGLLHDISRLSDNDLVLYLPGTFFSRKYGNPQSFGNPLLLQTRATLVLGLVKSVLARMLSDTSRRRTTQCNFLPDDICRLISMNRNCCANNNQPCKPRALDTLEWIHFGKMAVQALSVTIPNQRILQMVRQVYSGTF